MGRLHKNQVCVCVWVLFLIICIINHHLSLLLTYTAALHLLVIADCPSYTAVHCWRSGLPCCRSWNSLPQPVTSTPCMSVFRGRLKAFLFRRSFLWLVTSTVIIFGHLNCSFYLLTYCSSDSCICISLHLCSVLCLIIFRSYTLLPLQPLSKRRRYCVAWRHAVCVCVSAELQLRGTLV